MCLQMIIRAHQATAAGVDLTESARVCTVFSTSKDHGCGANATCGCLLIEGGVIHAIARSICYNMETVPSSHECKPASHGRTPTSSVREEGIRRGRASISAEEARPAAGETSHITVMCIS